MPETSIQLEALAPASPPPPRRTSQDPKVGTGVSVLRYIRRGSDGVLIALFLAALCLPVAGRWLGIGGVFNSASENRRPAPFPAIPFTLQGLSQFHTAFEAYLNDNLGFRTALILAHGWVKVVALGDSSTDRVILGRQGWLYYNGRTSDLSDDVADYRGSSPLTDGQLRGLRREILDRRDQLAKLGIPYVLMVCPNKATIYPEFLPGGLSQRAAELSPLDQFERATADDNLTIVDPRKALMEFKLQHPDLPLYFKTDTHWTPLGAFIAYKQLCDVARKQVPSIRPLRDQDVQIVRQVAHPGDLANMLGFPNSFRDASVEANPIYPFEVNIVRLNEGNLVRSECADPTLPRLYMRRDSFTNAMIPFLTRNFHHATFVSNLAYDVVPIADARPSMVVDQIVERSFRLWAMIFEKDDSHSASEALPPEPQPASTQPAISATNQAAGPPEKADGKGPP